MQVFRKADASAISLIEQLLEYTPTQRLSAIQAMVHPFFDELRDPNTRLPDSRHTGGASKDMPALFDFSHHGECICEADRPGDTTLTLPELSIAPEMNQKLVPPHIKASLRARGLDIDSPSFKPLSKDEMLARLD